MLARNLRVSVGDELTLLGSARDGSFAAAIVNVVGVFESGSDELDRALAETPLGFFQETFAMGDAGNSVVIRAPDQAAVPDAGARAAALRSSQPCSRPVSSPDAPVTLCSGTT